MVEATKWLGRGRLSVVLAVGLTLCVMLLLSVLPSRALADTEEGHSGYVGPHRLQEPGAACLKENSTGKVVVTAPPPLVWARSNYPGGQYVAYQAVLFRTDYASEGRHYVYEGPKYTRLAYPNSRANFPHTQFNLGYMRAAQNYKVRIFMFWYYPSNGAQMGYSSHFVDYYLQANTNTTVPYYCRV